MEDLTWTGCINGILDDDWILSAVALFWVEVVCIVVGVLWHAVDLGTEC